MAHRGIEEWEVLGAMWVIHGGTLCALLCVYANSCCTRTHGRRRVFWTGPKGLRVVYTLELQVFRVFAFLIQLELGNTAHELLSNVLSPKK